MTTYVTGKMQHSRAYEGLKRYWAGEYPLAGSLFGGGVAVVAAALLMSFTIAQINLVVLDWPIGFLFPMVELVFVACGLALALAIWLIGVWRSADRRRLEKKRVVSSVLAQVVVVLLALSFARAYIADVVPLFPDAFADLIEDPEWGTRSVELMDGEGTLEVRGYITRSVVKELEKKLEENPRISVVLLTSDGGRQRAAVEAMRLIRNHRIDTMVSGECISACVIAFLGGRRRLITTNAQLGFHAARAGGDIVGDEDRDLIDEIAGFGVSRDFLDKAFSTSQMWYPDQRELIKASVVTGVVSQPKVRRAQ